METSTGRYTPSSVEKLLELPLKSYSETLEYILKNAGVSRQKHADIVRVAKNRLQETVQLYWQGRTLLVTGEVISVREHELTLPVSLKQSVLEQQLLRLQERMDPTSGTGSNIHALSRELSICGKRGRSEIEDEHGEESLSSRDLLELESLPEPQLLLPPGGLTASSTTENLDSTGTTESKSCASTNLPDGYHLQTYSPICNPSPSKRVCFTDGDGQTGTKSLLPATWNGETGTTGTRSKEIDEHSAVELLESSASNALTTLSMIILDKSTTGQLFARKLMWASIERWQTLPSGQRGLDLLQQMFQEHWEHLVWALLQISKEIKERSEASADPILGEALKALQLEIYQELAEEDLLPGALHPHEIELCKTVSPTEAQEQYVLEVCHLARDLESRLNPTARINKLMNAEAGKLKAHNKKHRYDDESKFLKRAVSTASSKPGDALTPVLNDESEFRYRHLAHLTEGHRHTLPNTLLETRWAILKDRDAYFECLEPCNPASDADAYSQSISSAPPASQLWAPEEHLVPLSTAEVTKLMTNGPGEKDAWHAKNVKHAHDQTRVEYLDFLDECFDNNMLMLPLTNMWAMQQIFCGPKNEETIVIE